MKWKKVKLTDISKPKQWKNLPISELTSEGYAVYGANGIIGRYNVYNHEFPTLAITCRGATCGTINITEPKSYITSNAMALDEISDEVNQMFLYYALNKKGFKEVITGAAQPQITREGLSKIVLDIPESKEYQLHIANLLSKAETLISQRKESIRLLDQYLKSTFLEMFGDPIRNEKGFTSITLGELFRLSSGNGLTSENMDPLGIHNVYGGNGINGKYDKFMFEEPQIVIGRVGYYCGAVHLTEPKSWVTDNALYIKELYKASNIQYLKHFLTLLKLNRVAGQAAQPLISGNRLYPIKTFYPPLSLQNQFAQIVEKTEALKIQYQQSLQELENLYGSLSQKAFKGELTIKEEYLLQAAEPSMEYKKSEKF